MEIKMLKTVKPDFPFDMFEPESYKAAAMLLPRFAEVGKYWYKLEKE